MPEAIDVAGLTDVQAAALRFIAAHIRTHGTSPGVEEVRAALGLSSRSSAHRALTGLRERGRIRWTDRRKRSITIVADPRAGHVLPPELQSALERFCCEHHEEPSRVVADAVALHLDELGAIAAACGGAL